MIEEGKNMEQKAGMIFQVATCMIYGEGIFKIIEKLLLIVEW